MTLPKDAHVLPLGLVNMLPYVATGTLQMGNSTDGIKSRTSRREISLHCPGEPDIHEVFYSAVSIILDQPAGEVRQAWSTFLSLKAKGDQELPARPEYTPQISWTKSQSQ